MKPSNADRQSATALVSDLALLAERIDKFIKNLSGFSADEVEVWLERRRTSSYTFQDQTLTAGPVGPQERLCIRVERDGLIGTRAVEGGELVQWREAARAAAGDLQAPGTLTQDPPRGRRPPPVTFDAALADQLSGGQLFERLAFALMDNTWHEAERIPGLSHLKGAVAYSTRQVVVGRSTGVVHALHGAIRAHIELDGVYGDAFHQVHAPESFLPLALMGARTWRTMPHHRARPADLNLPGRLPVVLHPRLLERLLRRVLPPLFSEEARTSGVCPFGDGELVAATSVTLVDDPGLDGLAGSQAFDDEGVPTRRTPVLVRGRLTQLLRSSGTDRTAGGSRWRGEGPGLAAAPHQEPLRVGFGSLLMERGELGFSELVGALDRAILVQDLTELQSTGMSFSGMVRWGVTLERGRDARLLQPGAWHLSGRLLTSPKGPGFLSEVVFSRELFDTGTAVLPYALGFLDVS